MGHAVHLAIDDARRERESSQEDRTCVYMRLLNDIRYGGFSELLSCSPDEARNRVADRSVDLLHLNCCGSVERVRMDFTRWRDKLSDRAVVLLHNTNLRDGTVEVWRFWEELVDYYPTFEFLHRHGLGVLAFGNAVSREIAALCSLKEPVKIAAIREKFSRLGDLCAYYGKESAEGPVAQTNNSKVKEYEEKLARAQADFVERHTIREQMRSRPAQRTAQARLEASRVNANFGSASAYLNATQRNNNRSNDSWSRNRIHHVSGEPDVPGNLYRVERYSDAANAAGFQARWIRVDRTLEELLTQGHK